MNSPNPTGPITGSPCVPTTSPMARPPSLLDEHAVLIKCLGRLQRRMDQLRAEHEREIGVLNAELVRLRAQMVLAHTRACWRIGVDLGQRVRASPDANPGPHPAGAAVREPRPSPAPALAAAQVVICQTGCAGHAHPWLEADGQCRLSGLACDATRVRSDR